MAARKKPTVNPVAFPNRYLIEGDWYWSNLFDSPGRDTLLLTKEQVEGVLSDHLASNPGDSYWGGSAPWDGDEEPSVYVLLEDGTFRLVDVDLPVTEVRIKE